MKPKESKTYKPNPQELEVLTIAIEGLKVVNQTLADAAKLGDIHKATLHKFVCEREQLEPTKEPGDVLKASFAIGSCFIITGIALVEIGKQNRFDEKTFAANNLETYLAHKVDAPTVKTKALV